MAVSELDDDSEGRADSGIQLKSFRVQELFGYLNHEIQFPQMQSDASAPEILIVEGQNGTGKTTIMKMIDGILSGLNFDEFRKVPFRRAELELSNGDVFGVERDPKDPEFPIVATFRDYVVPLHRDRNTDTYTTEQTKLIETYREVALPPLRGIDFELLTIDRSVFADSKSGSDVYVDARTGEVKSRGKTRTLAGRVRDFLREAQVNYRRFFQANELELLPRILRQFNELKLDHDPDTLLRRVNAIKDKNSMIARFGLQTDQPELDTLANLLSTEAHRGDRHAISLLANYVEIHENRSKSRELIALRLSLFEAIMDDFFVGKKIQVSFRHGLEIVGEAGRLQERDLSSGEFHFLYMMVTALLCERIGTIIAIDEPELSLHVSWQRRLIGALSKCSSGASPLFFLCTHSTSISAAHKYAVQTLSSID